MADVGTAFLDFLKANYPEDYSKLSNDNVSDALINSVFTKHTGKFDIWKKVPEWVRDKYIGRVPQDLLDMANRGETMTPQKVTDVESNRTKSDQTPSEYGINGADAAGITFDNSDIVAIGVLATAISAKGYSPEAANRLAADRQVREKILQKHPQGTEQNLSPKEKQLWAETRQNDFTTIKKDWIENQPERYATHLLKQLDAGKIEQSVALPQLGTLMAKIKEKGRIEEFKSALKSPQSRFKNYNESTKTLLAQSMLSHGIINPKNARKKPEISQEDSRNNAPNTIYIMRNKTDQRE